MSALAATSCCSADADVRPAIQQVGRQTGRHRHVAASGAGILRRAGASPGLRPSRMLSSFSCCSMRRWVSAMDASAVETRILRLIDILHRGHAAFLARRGEDEGVGADAVGALGDFQFVVQLQQAEVSRGHLGDQRLPHGLLRVLGREQLGAGGLVRAADPAPEVHFVGRHRAVNTRHTPAAGSTPGGMGEGPVLGGARGGPVAAGAHGGEELRAGHPRRSLGLQHAGGGDLDVPIVGQRLARCRPGAADPAMTCHQPRLARELVADRSAVSVAAARNVAGVSSAGRW